MPALDVLLASIRDEARLSPTGHVVQHARLVEALCTRLRLRALLERYPEIVEQPVPPLVVVAGVQRSGTTKLHRLLAADPETRALRSWEALDPLPRPGEARGEGHLRRRRARLAQAALRYLAPDFLAVHPVETDEPEEDVLLLDLSFMSQTPEATMHVPSYARWLEAQDDRPAYALLRRLLQVLTWQRPGRRWVLKTPEHLEHLDALLEIFPDTTVIQTHRDPRQTMASFCSMVAHGRGVFSDHVDPHEVGRHWLRKVRRMGQRAVATRQRHPERFCDVGYEALVGDPVGELERIHAHLGGPLSAQARAAMQAADAHNVQHRHGVHRYALEDFGLTRADVDRELGFLRALVPEPASAPMTPRAPVAAPLHSTTTGLGHRDALRATATGLLDLVRHRTGEALSPVPSHVRLDGRTCLVTGANRGLGLATARALAERGARVLVACRTEPEATARRLSQQTGNPQVEGLFVDLADLDTVDALCDQLLRRGERLDVVVLNAGLMPKRARPTAQGLEVMLGVHVVANHRLLSRWLADGVLRPADPGGPGDGPRPRVVVVSSEVHRSADGVDPATMPTWVDYGVRDGMRQYAATKLLLCALVTALRERARSPTEPNGPREAWLGAHALCPGPVDTDIAREAPPWIMPVLRPVMHAFFRSPDEAAAPVVSLACDPSLEMEEHVYLHSMLRKAMDPRATDPAFARAVWARCEALQAALGLRP
ncbi:SDR family NAD(P)-dependent oxidoreductase [Paraliomyxa miuraensis]|uniref:SDR family NAD(P)-dependent oxidoreductase n=1 Tax=Paraliomyxa miuraensis TaxID=376150 RepID=UPI00224D17EB|nr:SDR family NAD(P)-dependent oxidoreductase [Paraliomyxa miuraensis]MCX4240702.1 SDR family NAD(P)-dependent oxidoreductase [Paraliomyxa miuraensis]